MITLTDVQTTVLANIVDGREVTISHGDEGMYVTAEGLVYVFTSSGMVHTFERTG